MARFFSPALGWMLVVIYQGQGLIDLYCEADTLDRQIQCGATRVLTRIPGISPEMTDLSGQLDN